MSSQTIESWGAGSKTLHWVLAIMILLEAPLGYLMSSTYGPALKLADMKPLHELLAQLHHTNGFLILALAAVRLGWRGTHPAPDLPASLALYERWLARLTQGFLYLLMFAIPLSGWAALSSLADSDQFGKTAIWFFGSDAMPRLPFVAPKPFNDPTGYQSLGGLHRNLFYVGAGLLGLHVIGAFWHHLVRKDGVLLNMWPGSAPRGQ